MSDHDKAWQHIPWLVNGTLEGEALEEVRQHLSACAECRAELALQTRLRDAMAAQPTVEFAPQSSFNKLWARIDADTQAQLPPATRPQRRWWWAMAAQWLLMAGLAWWYVQSTAPDYRTVTNEASTPAGELKVVFDSSTTLEEVGAVLAVSGLVSVAGPTPSGVLVLSRDTRHARMDLDTIVTQLRADPRIRFAERSQ